MSTILVTSGFTTVTTAVVAGISPSMEPNVQSGTKVVDTLV